ncbi:hypothetical protein F4W67_20755 [Pseudomonas caricapapayae]|nr:hypothetical protein F4W67_20755 [Pseudomonas caricapapayae]
MLDLLRSVFRYNRAEDTLTLVATFRVPRDQNKQNPRSCFRPDLVGFLRPDIDPEVAPDQCHDSAVTHVALCVVSAIANKNHL